MKIKLTFAAAALFIALAHGADSTVVLFEDGFGQMRNGSIGSEVGAHAEYHYLPEVGAKGNWFISAFVSGAAPQRAWRIARHNDQPVLLQTYENKQTHTHPMVVARRMRTARSVVSRR